MKFNLKLFKNLRFKSLRPYTITKLGTRTEFSEDDADEEGDDIVDEEENDQKSAKTKPAATEKQESGEENT